MTQEKSFQGVVIKSTGSLYTVQTADGQRYPCVVKGNFRIKGIRSTNPIAVGDYVVFDKPQGAQQGIIKELLERKNYIVRRAANLSKQVHVVAANIDQAILVVTLKEPETHLEFIDRYLATAEAYRIPAVLVFNKCDIYLPEEKKTVRQCMELYQRIGYPCLETSAEKKINIEAFRQLLAGKTSLLSGVSGTGKSSLINAVEPQLNLKTAPLSSYHHAGVHTTTFAEMFPLSFGGYIIDTPGIRGFGVIDMNKNEIFHFFPEIFKAARDCRFYNCLHIQEPGCAVIEAVRKGEIAWSRYRSYLSIYEDKNEKYR